MGGVAGDIHPLQGQAEQLAPPEYKKISPLGTSPAITDDEDSSTGASKDGDMKKQPFARSRHDPPECLRCSFLQYLPIVGRWAIRVQVLFLIEPLVKKHPFNDNIYHFTLTWIIRCCKIPVVLRLI